VSFSASVFKEIQRLLFFVCNELYYAKDSMREEAGNNFLAKKYFGDPTDPDSTGVVKMFVTGDDYFSEAFISEFVTTNCITKPKNVLNPKLTRMSGITIYVGNDAGDVIVALIWRRSMSKDEGMVNGLYIRDQMVIVMRTLTKATAYGKEYLDSKGNGPSGGNEHVSTCVCVCVCVCVCDRVTKVNSSYNVLAPNNCRFNLQPSALH
jgi:hypothetical protein